MIRKKTLSLFLSFCLITFHVILKSNISLNGVESLSKMSQDFLVVESEEGIDSAIKNKKESRNQIFSNSNSNFRFLRSSKKLKRQFFSLYPSHSNKFYEIHSRGPPLFLV